MQSVRRAVRCGAVRCVQCDVKGRMGSKACGALRKWDSGHFGSGPWPVAVDARSSLRGMEKNRQGWVPLRTRYACAVMGRLLICPRLPTGPGIGYIGVTSTFGRPRNGA